MGASIDSVVTLVLALLVVVVTGKHQGMAIWSDGDENPASYALWDGSEFSSSLPIRTTTRSFNVIRGAYSPIQDESIFLMGVRGSEQISTAQMYSGGQWSNLSFGGKASSFFSSSIYDVRYESQSGNPLLVWLEYRATIRYAKWTGSTWSLGTITATKAIVLHLEPNPKSNEMVLVVDSGSVDKYTVVWDGDSWGDALVLKSSRPDCFLLDPVNVAYEQQSGKAIIIYADDSAAPKYRTWNGQAWSAEGSISPPAGYSFMYTCRVTVSADPSTNRIVAAVSEDFLRDRNWVAVWDGNNSWGSQSETSNGGRSALFNHGIALAFEGASQRAIATYAKSSSMMHYRTWSSSSGWSEEENGPILGAEPTSVMLAADKGSNDIIMAVHESSQALFYKWNGTGWGEEYLMTKHTAGKTSTPYEPFFFMWRPHAVTIAPTAFPSHLPTPSPTTSPTSAPTKQPTAVPTPRPTRSPTDQPSLPPTPTPTSLPTPVLTPPLTQAPSMKLTKAPPPAPTGGRHVDQETGHPCDSNNDCKSNTCRNGVCMATSACYPLRHKFGEAFFEHKVNIVFVASGFDTATIDEWHADVNRTSKSFEEHNMFSNKVEQLNVFRVDPSKLDSVFCALDCLGIPRLLCCDKRRALRLAQKCFSVGSNLQTVVIHNDKRYGGGGYVKDNMATVTTHPMASVIAAHELVHSLFDLNDEYSYGPGTDKDPNCASTSSCDKWSDLIGNTPAGYDPVRCLPGCRNNNFYVGTLSFMNSLRLPMGAVNERFTCCTYLALTKSLPSYCDEFNPSPNYLFNYCKTKDYQGYGSASYDKEPLLAISNGSVQDSSTKYVQVEHPALVSISAKKKRSGAIVYKSKLHPLDPGMFLRSQVEGDFSSPRMALKQGCDSLLKVTAFYRTGKETSFYSRNTTIEVPISLDPPDEDEPLVVSEETGSLNCVLDTMGRDVRRVRVVAIDLTAQAK